MRTIIFDKDTYRGEIRTSDLICPAYGNNYLDIAFVQESQEIPDKVTIGVEGTTLSFTLPVRYSRLATEQLDGVFFNLEWLKYYAPLASTKGISIDVYADSTIVATIPYMLTAGHEEIDVGKKYFITNSDKKYFCDDVAILCPTQRTEHWAQCEVLIKKTPDKIEVESGINGDMFRTPTDVIFSIGLKTISTEIYLNIYIDVMNEETQSDIYNIARYDVKPTTCYDMELRITNRHGLRGVIGGKIVDASEGGDDVKSNFNKVTPYAGIYEWSKKGATIKKEVGFNFEGDEGLLGLLRDGCVYGRVEWYDERTEQWLPCRIEEKSIGNNAWDEQIVTIVLQEL